MNVSLDRLIKDGALGAMHIAMSRLIQRLAPSDGDFVYLATAVLSEQLARGHVCLDLATVDQIAFSVGPNRDKYVRYDDWPTIDQWLEQLGDSPVVDALDAGDSDEPKQRPLVLDRRHRRLYLARYWHYEQRLARSIGEKIMAKAIVLDEDKLAEDIRTLFPDRNQPGGQDQCLAAANAVDQRFSVINGGPGTGKTTTVAKLLALRMMNNEGARKGDDELRIVLMAPTGKAAQRVNESLGRVAQHLEISDALRASLLSVKAGTIHRALGWTPLPAERGGPFTHNADFPIDADVVLVDEASMVDLGLMYRLFEAIGPDSQIILMGDCDQLSSVEAGGVLADLCGDTDSLDLSRMSKERRTRLAKRTGLPLPTDGDRGAHILSDHVFNLRHSHRFDSSGELGQLAGMIRSGDADGVVEFLGSAVGGGIEWVRCSTAAEALTRVVDVSADAYADYINTVEDHSEHPLDVLAALARYRILCAHRSGPLGETNVNERVANRLQDMGLVRLKTPLYAGCPVMISSNDYQQRLFNGDVGAMVQAAGNADLVGLFEDASAEGGHRLVPAALLPANRPCYAMTIHKSQGSEFHHVMVVLPHHRSPIVTRELLYTAVTRVADAVDPKTNERKHGRLHIVAREEVIRDAVASRIRRTSGLFDALQPSSTSRRS